MFKSIHIVTLASVAILVFGLIQGWSGLRLAAAIGGAACFLVLEYMAYHKRQSGSR